MNGVRGAPGRVFVTGATGLIGGALCARLIDDGAEVVAVSRHRGGEARGSGLRFVKGDVTTVGDWQAEVAEADAVVHLAGESVVSGRWTPSVKAAIRDSRIDGTRHVVDAIARSGRSPKVLVCASACGYYGQRGDEVLDESAPPGDDFLAGVCVAWEAEARRAASFGVRVVSLRFGLVLAAEGGALPRMLTPFRFGLGGPLGPSDRFVPWVHLDDVVGLARFSLVDGPDAPHGALNVVGPEAVRMGDFARELGRALGRPALLPVPEFALRLVLGEATDAVVPGQRVVPRAALGAGYRFAFPGLRGALGDLVG